MQCEIVRDWTHLELRREILIWTGIKIGQTQFYTWLPFALIAKKRIYTDRDRRKLLKFAQFMSRYGRLRKAREALIKDMKTKPEDYPNDI